MASVNSQKVSSIAELKVLVAKSELDRYFSLFQECCISQVGSNQQVCLTEAERALYQASKIFQSLVGRLRGDERNSKFVVNDDKDDCVAEIPPDKARKFAYKTTAAQPVVSGVETIDLTELSTSSKDLDKGKEMHGDDSELISVLPSHTKCNNQSVNNKMTPPRSYSSKDSYCSKKTIDAIYLKSRSIPNFATRLMVHLFDQSELLECVNVYGRPTGARWQKKLSTSWSPNGLDEKRVQSICEQVKQRAGSKYSSNVWQLCLNAMNYKLFYVKQRSQISKDGHKSLSKTQQQ